VSGRKDDKDLNFSDDKSRIYITMNSDIDKNLKTDDVEGSSGVVAAIGIKSDEIRIVARKGMKIVIEDGTLNVKASSDIKIKSDSKITVDAPSVIVESPSVKVGSSSSSEPLVLGTQLKNALTTFLIAFTPFVGLLGSVSVPTHPAIMTAANNLISALNLTILSQKHNTE
jgi:hypothetical protein